MNKEFSFRAKQIIGETLETIQQADELAGLELNEYIDFMDYLIKELNERKKCAIKNLIIKNDFLLKGLNNE
jgi:hypothetical protein